MTIPDDTIEAVAHAIGMAMITRQSPEQIARAALVAAALAPSGQQHAEDVAYLKGLEDGTSTERERILALIGAFECLCGEPGCTVHRDILDALAARITETEDVPDAR